MAAHRPGGDLPHLLAISDRRASQALGMDLSDWFQDLARAWSARAGVGVRLAVQVREKDLDDASLLDVLRQARAMLPPAIPVLVNGRADLAVAAGAEGVHLPSATSGVGSGFQASQGADRRLLVGRSTHTADQVAAARRQGVDYATFGPVFFTPSKAAYGPPPGLEGLAAASRIGLPLLGLGGVTAERLPEVAAAGAHGAAAIRAFADEAATAAMLDAARCFLAADA